MERCFRSPLAYFDDDVMGAMGASIDDMKQINPFNHPGLPFLTIYGKRSRERSGG